MHKGMDHGLATFVKGGSTKGVGNQKLAPTVEARELRGQVARDNAALQENILVVLEVVAAAADGDLSRKVPVTTGALGNVADAINAMFESVSRLVKQITEAATRVSSEAREIHNAR